MHLSGVSVFQRVIQKAVLRRANQIDNWHIWLRSEWKRMSCNQFDAAFSKADIECKVETGAAGEFIDGDSSDSEQDSSV